MARWPGPIGSENRRDSPRSAASMWASTASSASGGISSLSGRPGIASVA
jgi:hypothetical protein